MGIDPDVKGAVVTMRFKLPEQNLQIDSPMSQQSLCYIDIRDVYQTEHMKQRDIVDQDFNNFIQTLYTNTQCKQIKERLTEKQAKSQQMEQNRLQKIQKYIDLKLEKESYKSRGDETVYHIDSYSDQELQQQINLFKKYMQNSGQKKQQIFKILTKYQSKGQQLSKQGVSKDIKMYQANIGKGIFSNYPLNKQQLQIKSIQQKFKSKANFVKVDNMLFDSLLADKVQIFDNPRKEHHINSSPKLKRTSVNPKLAYEIIQRVKEDSIRQGSSLFCILEAATYGLDHQRKTILQQGINQGIWLSALQNCDVWYSEVRSHRWKRDLKLFGQDKNASRGLASRFSPQSQEQLRRQKDHGRAEALLLAVWGAKQLTQGHAFYEQFMIHKHEAYKPNLKVIKRKKNNNTKSKRSKKFDGEIQPKSSIKANKKMDKESTKSSESVTQIEIKAIDESNNMGDKNKTEGWPQEAELTVQIKKELKDHLKSVKQDQKDKMNQYEEYIKNKTVPSSVSLEEFQQYLAEWALQPKGSNKKQLQKQKLELQSQNSQNLNSQSCQLQDNGIFKRKEECIEEQVDQPKRRGRKRKNVAPNFSPENSSSQIILQDNNNLKSVKATDKHVSWKEGNNLNNFVSCIDVEDDHNVNEIKIKQQFLEQQVFKKLENQDNYTQIKPRSISQSIKKKVFIVEKAKIEDKEYQKDTQHCFT